MPFIITKYMKRVYYKCRWSKKDLNGKTVQFDLPLTAGGLRVNGFGVFIVHVRKDLVSIDIEEFKINVFSRFTSHPLLIELNLIQILQ